MLKINRTYEISFWSSFYSRSILGNLKILNFFDFFRIIFLNTIFRIRIEEGNPLYIQIIVIEILIFYLINNLFLISLTKLIISKNFYAYVCTHHKQTYISDTRALFQKSVYSPKFRRNGDPLIILERKGPRLPTRKRRAGAISERKVVASEKFVSRSWR